jgi:hypothetical protein
LFAVHRETPQKGEGIPNQWVFEELLFGHKVKQGLKREADDRDIGPVLMFGKNDHRPMIRKDRSLLRLDPVKNGKKPLSHLLGCEVDKGIPFHCQKPISNFKIQMPNSRFELANSLSFEI